MLHKGRECCKPAKWALGQSHRNLAISSQYKSSDGLTLIELPVEKSNTGKISYKKTVYYLPLSKIKKGILTWLKIIEVAHAPSPATSLPPLHHFSRS